MAISPELHIMLLDNVESDAQAIKEILTRTGFKRVNSFSRPNEALDYFSDSMFRGDPIKMVICDAELAEMSGIDFFVTLNRVDTAKSTKFLMLSANSDQTFILTAVKAGVRYILLKPFSRQSLIAELAKILG